MSEISIFPLRFNFRLDLFYNRTKAGSQKAALAKRTLVKSCVAGFAASMICVLHTFIMNITTSEGKIPYTRRYSADPARLSLVLYICGPYCTTIGNGCPVVVMGMSPHRSVRSSNYLIKTWQSNQSQCTIGFCRVSLLLFC